MANCSGYFQNIKIYVLIVIVSIYTSHFYNFVKAFSPQYRGAKIHTKGDVKYILQWSTSKYVPFFFSNVGQMALMNTKCTFTNCFITSYKELLGDYINFDVIAFSGPDVTTYNHSLLPQRRSPHQKYVFASMEPSYSYPVNSNGFDGFFNWTWTYKLNSDLRWGFLAVRDTKGHVIGPNIEMHWMKREEMYPVSEELLTILRAKNKTAVGFISNCVTPSKREVYITELNYILVTKYNFKVDIYGKCGQLKCFDTEGECPDSYIRQYYFYLAFEATFSEDFVTDTLLQALTYNTVPIVYGGANYTRFLPEGSYLNAKKLDAEALAATINELVHDFDKYKQYFKWTNHYMYHSTIDSEDTNEYCQMCALLNDEKRLHEISVYDNFRLWWNHKNHEIEEGKVHDEDENENSIRIPELALRKGYEQENTNNKKYLSYFKNVLPKKRKEFQRKPSSYKKNPSLFDKFGTQIKNGWDSMVGSIQDLFKG